MLLSCPGSSSFLWIGKTSSVPFFKRSDYEMVPMVAINLTDEELLKWVKFQVKKLRPGSVSNGSSNGDVVVPFVCERAFTNENLSIER
jgi:hypothetical protein